MTLIFDYDGTLHNTAHLYGCAFRKSYQQLVKNGYAEKRYYSDKEMSKYLGMTPGDMWSSFMPQLPKEITEEVSLSIGKEMIEMISDGAAQLYDGIEESLSELRRSGYKMVILSNCKNDYLKAHRKHFDLDRWFDGYYCAEKYNYIPKEKIFSYIKNDFDDEQYVLIGDRESDFKVGLDNNIPVIGCSYGFGTKSELSVCDLIIDSPHELPKCIKLIPQKP